MLPVVHTLSGWVSREFSFNRSGFLVLCEAGGCLPDQAGRILDFGGF